MKMKNERPLTDIEEASKNDGQYSKTAWKSFDEHGRQLLILRFHETYSSF